MGGPQCIPRDSLSANKTLEPSEELQKPLNPSTAMHSTAWRVWRRPQPRAQDKGVGISPSWRSRTEWL